MDFLKITKVENVLLEKSQVVDVGTLHLTTHQMIFRYSNGNDKEELWISYPIIHTVERRPPTSEPKYWPLLIKCRNFVFVTLSIQVESMAIDVFDTVQRLTCINSISNLYAFYYKPEREFKCNDGWKVYDPYKEFNRMGGYVHDPRNESDRTNSNGKTASWKFSYINEDYMLCATYPRLLVVPIKINDPVLTHAAKFRSKSRIPTLSYLHHNKASITRSSQPMVGIQKKRSIQDEKLIQAIFESNLSNPTISTTGRPVFGSTPHNLIIDARPTANAMANTAMGAGSENTDYYKNCEKKFMGIDNIHVMRDSLTKIVDILQMVDSQGLPIKKYQLDKSNWLKHISILLSSANEIIENVNVKASHVLIHCSDGWDRTAQLTSISELCLDPYYRTFRGFQVLIEKEWVSFGHKFSDRSGHLSNERYFINTSTTNAAGSALNSVQNKLYKQSHVREISPVFHQFLDCVYQLFHQNPTRFEFNEKFLVELHYHCYSCQFGTFLFNSEKERKDYSVTEKTYSVWDCFNSDKESYLNPQYCGEENDRDPKGDMGVLYSDTKNLKYWAELFKRKDEELNGNNEVNEEEGFGARLRWRSDSPRSWTQSLPSLTTDPLGIIGIGGDSNSNDNDNNENEVSNDNGIWSATSTISKLSISSPPVDFDAGSDPWKTSNGTNSDNSSIAEEKEKNIFGGQDFVQNFAKLTKNMYSNVATIASKMTLDLDSNNTFNKNKNDDENEEVSTTPREELEDSSTPIKEMVSLGESSFSDDDTMTSIISNGKQFPTTFLSRKEINSNSLPSLGVRTTPPSSPYLRTISGSSTPTYEKPTSSNNNGSLSPKLKLNDLEKSLMMATNTSMNPSGLGLGLNFGGSSSSSSNSSNSPSRSNSLSATMSFGGGSDTNSKNNSPFNTPSIQNSPSVLKPQDKIKELPHPLYNDPLSSP